MNTDLTFAVFHCFLLIGCFQMLGMAAPTLQANNNAPIVSNSSDIKRDAEYRNILFGMYSCRIKKAADAVRAKLEFLQVTFIIISNTGLHM